MGERHPFLSDPAIGVGKKRERNNPDDLHGEVEAGMGAPLIRKVGAAVLFSSALLGHQEELGWEMLRL